jgi:glycosyltransferase involved in cell wall biosynthesis
MKAGPDASKFIAVSGGGAPLQSTGEFMRIIQVANVRWYNATAWYALTLAELLQKAGHEVLMVCLQDTEPYQRAVDLNLPVTSLNLNSNNPLALAAASANLVRLVKSFRPQVVNCHRGESFFLWAGLRRLGFPYKLVRTRGDQRFPKSDRLNRWLHDTVADAVVVTNRRMAEYFRTRMRTAPEKLWIIRGGVDTRRFAFDPEGRSRIRREFGFTDQDTVIGLAGRFDEVKGQKELIQAISRLRWDLEMKNIRLLLVGFESAVKESQVRAWLADYDVADISALTGKRDDIAACYSALDLAVVASLYSEAIARAPLELMAAGRPILSTSVGVLPDLLDPEALVAPGDTPALVLKIVEYLRHKSLRDRIISRQRLSLSQHTLEEFLRRSLNLYQCVLEPTASL